MFKKLWKGEYPLWVTFWIFGVLINVLFRVSFYYIEANYIAFLKNFGIYSIYLLFFIAIVYSVFIWIAIWRSANNYKGSQFLAAAAKLTVILGALNMLFNYNTGLLNTLLSNKEPSINDQLKETSLLLNKSLPIKVDASTELYKISSGKNQLIYYYRLNALNEQQKEHIKNNWAKIQSNLRNSIIAKGCNNQDIKYFITQDVELIYYYELEGHELGNIRLTKSDCKN